MEKKNLRPNELLAYLCNAPASKGGYCPSVKYLQCEELGEITRTCPFRRGCSVITPQNWKAVWKINELLREAESYYSGLEGCESPFCLPQRPFLDTIRILHLLKQAEGLANKNWISLSSFVYMRRFRLGGTPG